ncbi:hypothetical protein [Actinoplanes sp. NPDC026670]|uniref:hypothetical protein n=1 Tax=Actinoplanes sp. NPDC026670 TaxID=3154700 RepID=UPI0033E9F7F1
MHDEMLTLFDDCIERMLQLRAHLSASRRVHPGERHATVVSAIEVAARFASEATRTVSPPAGPPQPAAPTPPLEDPARPHLAAFPAAPAPADLVRPFPAALPAASSPASPDPVRLLPAASLPAPPDPVRPLPAVLPAVASPASPDLVRPCPAALPPLPAEPAPLAARLTAVPGRHTTLAPAP